MGHVIENFSNSTKWLDRLMIKVKYVSMFQYVYQYSAEEGK